MTDWNTRVVAEFRANSGQVAWSTADDLAAGRPVPPRLPSFGDRGLPILLLHHTGARTGRERITPLLYQAVGDGYAVFATFGGSPSHPAWYRNLLAQPRTAIEVGAATVAVRARLTNGAERERIWATQEAFLPKFAEFEASAGRRIPVVVLDPT